MEECGRNRAATATNDEWDCEDLHGMAQALAGLTGLMVAIKFGQLLTGGDGAAAKKPVRRKPDPLPDTARRFDFAALPPRVECGC